MEDNKKDAINNIRPPNLWNHPKVKDDPHQYRYLFIFFIFSFNFYMQDQMPNLKNATKIIGFKI